MARKEDKNKARELRAQGMSYSQIKQIINVNKSTLSGWLSDMPLSKERINELQHSELVIEKIRTAKQKTRDVRLTQVLAQVSTEIGKISKRELFIAGFFLYWAEGGKTTRYTISLSNTDPRMIRAFLVWLGILGVAKERVTIKLHLYVDMDETVEIKYWMKVLGLPKTHFKRSYIKKSRLSELSYTTRGHGTCNAIVAGRDVAEFVLQGYNKIADFY